MRRVPLLQRILEEFELLYREYGVSSFPLEEYSSLCVSLGRRIRFFRNGSEVHGTAVAVEKDGGLVAELENGETAVVTSGEVVAKNPNVYTDLSGLAVGRPSYRTKSRPTSL